MAKFTVHMTLAAPTAPARWNFTYRLLPGRAAWMRICGGNGFVMVTASRVAAETPTEAAMLVRSAVEERWSKGRGPLVLRSWTAHRERVMLGARRGVDIQVWPRNTQDGDEGGGSAGVREPRRPLPGPGSLHATRDRPGPQF